MLSPKKIVIIIEIVFLVLLAMLYTEMANAHARFALDGILAPRSTNDGIKSGPCGGIPRSANPTVFRPGQQITVEWEETINHPGYYRIAFSPANDQGYDENVLLQVDDEQDDSNVPHQYSATITLPNLQCTDCSLQLIQYMTERDPPSLYYSCADIVLQDENSVNKPDEVINLIYANGENEATLSWGYANTTGIDFMVLQANNAIDTSPDDGMNYNTGDAIGNALVIYKGSQQYFVAENLQSGSGYYYSVFAVDLDSNYSNGVATDFTQPAFAVDNIAPGPVENVSGTAGDTYVTLNWQNPDNDFYKVLILKNSVPISSVPTAQTSYQVGDTIDNAEVVFNGLGNSAKIRQLSNGTGYHFRIFAHDHQFNYAAGVDNYTQLPTVAVNEAPTVSLVIKQGGVTVSSVNKNNGYVTVYAIVSDGNVNDSHSYDWLGTDTRLIDVDGAENTLTFDPGMLASSVYNLSVMVTDDGSPPISSTARSSVIIDNGEEMDDSGGGGVGHIGLLILLLFLQRYYSSRTRRI